MFNQSSVLPISKSSLLATSLAGLSLVGASTVLAQTIQLSGIGTAHAGFVINGATDGDYSGFRVSGAGDVNGDGLADVIISAPYATANGATYSGQCFVVFGKTTNTPVNLAVVRNGVGGFRIDGRPSDRLGRSISGLGDVNGDGLDDVYVGAVLGDPNGVSNAGQGYVVFGKNTGTPVNLSNVLNGTGGFVINGIAASDRFGGVGSGVGDFNGDGIGDLIIAGYNSQPNGYASGRACIVFGKSDGNPVNLATLNTTSDNGFSIEGLYSYDRLGIGLSGAGDVNGDGLSDIVIGSPNASPNGSSSGQSYVVFGKTNTEAILLSNVRTGVGGFAINGAAASDYSGSVVHGAGDLNGDGLSDVLVAAPYGENGLGTAYVVYGKTSGSVVSLAQIRSGIGGFAIIGSPAIDTFGGSLSAAGDVNGDGLSDLILGSPQADANGRNAGQGHVLFSPSQPETSATFKAAVRAGNAPPLAIGVLGDASNSSTPDSRVIVDFADGTNASVQTVTLTRNTPAVSGLTDLAAITWQLTTDRTGWTSAKITMNYTDAEISGLDEGSLILYSAPALDGPWSPVAEFIRLPQRNQLSGTVSTLGFFAISTAQPPSFPTLWSVY